MVAITRGTVLAGDGRHIAADPDGRLLPRGMFPHVPAPLAEARHGGPLFQR